MIHLILCGCMLPLYFTRSCFALFFTPSFSFALVVSPGHHVAILRLAPLTRDRLEAAVKALKEVAVALSSLLEITRRPTAPCESKVPDKIQKETQQGFVSDDYDWDSSKEADRLPWTDLARAVASYTGAMNEVTKGSTYTVEP